VLSAIGGNAVLEITLLAVFSRTFAEIDVLCNETLFNVLVAEANELLPDRDLAVLNLVTVFLTAFFAICDANFSATLCRTSRLTSLLCWQSRLQ